MPEQLTLTGGCLCGALRYEAIGVPTLSCICHCRMCQRASGGPIMALLFMPSSSVRFIKGEPLVYRSSPTASRHFCGQCGSPVFFERVSRSSYGIMVGSLDDPNSFKPQMHVCLESAMTWFEMHDGTTRYQKKPEGMTPLVDYDPTVGAGEAMHKS
jgi:hypothetical protein